MDINTLLNRLEGMHTLQSAMARLSIGRQAAIYRIHRLRKAGYVKTSRRSDNTRIYVIERENRVGGVSYEEVINRSSPIKIATVNVTRVHGREIPIEEAIVYAVSNGSVRTNLAALALFRKVDDWSYLYQMAKKEHVLRKVGALYDLARTLFRTRRMTDRFRNNALPKRGERYDYITPDIRSDDFKDIESIWKVHLPFNRADLEDYA